MSLIFRLEIFIVIAHDFFNGVCDRRSIASLIMSSSDITASVFNTFSSTDTRSLAVVPSRKNSEALPGSTFNSSSISLN